MMTLEFQAQPMLYCTVPACGCVRHCFSHTIQSRRTAVDSVLFVLEYNVLAYSSTPSSQEIQYNCTPVQLYIVLEMKGGLTLSYAKSFMLEQSGDVGLVCVVGTNYFISNDKVHPIAFAKERRSWE